MAVKLPAVKKAQRTDESVRVRGPRHSPVILISPRSLTLWRRDYQIQAVQLAHEMGHIWARDLAKSRFLSVGVCVVAVQLLWIDSTSASPDPWLVLVGAVTALINLRSYLRSREHAADFIAARLLGAEARDALAETTTPEGWMPSLLRTHPSAEERRQAFNDPTALFLGLRLPLFAFGFNSAFALNMATAAYRVALNEKSRTLPVQVLLPAFALLAAGSIGVTLSAGIPLVKAPVAKGWMRSYLLGTLTCFVTIALPHVRWSLVLAAVLAIAFLAKIYSGLSQLVFLMLGKPENPGRGAYVFSQGVLAVGIWTIFVELVYFQTLQPIAHVIAWLPGIN